MLPGEKVPSLLRIDGSEYARVLLYSVVPWAKACGYSREELIRLVPAEWLAAYIVWHWFLRPDEKHLAKCRLFWRLHGESFWRKQERRGRA